MGKIENLTPFKPGQSGNPKGRIKGSKNISTQLKKYLNAKELIPAGTYPIIPANQTKAIKLSMADIIALELIRKGRAGNLVAISDIQDRTEGKPMQHYEIAAATDIPPADPLAVTENVLRIELTSKPISTPHAADPAQPSTGTDM